jgi:hypothetical protein
MISSLGFDSGLRADMAALCVAPSAIPPISRRCLPLRFALGIALAIVPISVRAETKLRGTAAPQSTSTANRGQCQPSRAGAEFRRTDTSDRGRAGACSGSNVTGDRRGAKPGASDRARPRTRAAATATGCCADAGASAADCLASGSHDIDSTRPELNQTHVGRSTHRRQLGSGGIVPLPSNATQASFCAWRLRTRCTSNDDQARHNLGSHPRRI